MVIPHPTRSNGRRWTVVDIRLPGGAEVVGDSTAAPDEVVMGGDPAYPNPLLACMHRLMREAAWTHVVHGAQRYGLADSDVPQAALRKLLRYVTAELKAAMIDGSGK